MAGPQQQHWTWAGERLAAGMLRDVSHTAMQLAGWLVCCSTCLPAPQPGRWHTIQQPDLHRWCPSCCPPVSPCRQLAPVLLEAAAAGAALVGAMESLPEVAAAKSSGQPAPVRLGRPLYSLAASMPMIISLAHECGQAAAGAEAERVLGRTLRLLAVRGGQMAGAVAGGARIVEGQQGREPRPAACLERFAAAHLPP